MQIYISNKKKKIVLKSDNTEITEEIYCITVYSIIEKLKMVNSTENNIIIAIRKLYNENIVIKTIIMEFKQKLEKYTEFKTILDNNIYIVYRIFAILVYNICIDTIDTDNQIAITK